MDFFPKEQSSSKNDSQHATKDLKVVEPSANKSQNSGEQDIIPDEVPRKDGPGGEG